MPPPPDPSATIHSYLSSSLSLRATIDILTVPIADCQHNEEAQHTALKSLWRALLQSATLHPLDTPEQSALLTLLHGLKSDTETETAKAKADSVAPCSFASLPFLNETARAIFFDRPHDSRGSAARWTNLNAFLARATKDGLLVPGLQDLGIANAREALEMRQEPEERLDVLLAGAGVWMVVMGEEMWGYLAAGEGDKGGNEVWERWQFWKRRFLFMSHREDLSVASRELAAEADAVMERVA